MTDNQQKNRTISLKTSHGILEITGDQKRNIVSVFLTTKDDVSSKETRYDLVNNIIKVADEMSEAKPGQKSRALSSFVFAVKEIREDQSSLPTTQMLPLKDRDLLLAAHNKIVKGKFFKNLNPL